VVESSSFPVLAWRALIISINLLEHWLRDSLNHTLRGCANM